MTGAWVRVAQPVEGANAEHTAGLDPRKVTRVSDDGTLVWLDFFGAEHGPFPASNYEFYVPGGGELAIPGGPQ